MLVHGFYHLSGYDHMEDEEKSQMREKEEKCFVSIKYNKGRIMKKENKELKKS